MAGRSFESKWVFQHRGLPSWTRPRTSIGAKPRGVAEITVPCVSERRGRCAQWLAWSAAGDARAGVPATGWRKLWRSGRAVGCSPRRESHLNRCSSTGALRGAGVVGIAGLVAEAWTSAGVRHLLQGSRRLKAGQLPLAQNVLVHPCGVNRSSRHRCTQCRKRRQPSGVSRGNASTQLRRSLHRRLDRRGQPWRRSTS